MQALTADLAHTQAYAAVLLRKLFLGPVGLIAYALVLAVLTSTFLPNSQWEPIIIAVLLIINFVSVAHEFILEKLESDDAKPFEANNPLHLLGVDVVKELGKKPLTAQSLLEAAAATKRGSFLLMELDIDAKTLTTRCKAAMDALDFGTLLRECVEALPKLNEKRIHANAIIDVILHKPGPFRDVLNSCDLSVEDLDQVLRWERIHHQMDVSRKHHDTEQLVRAYGSIGRSWLVGYNDELDTLTVDLTSDSSLRNKRSTVIHQDSMKDLQHVLSRSALHNVMILGRIGTGRKTLVENFAIMLREYEIRHSLPYTRVLTLKTQELLSATARPDSMLLKALNQAAGSGKHIIFVPDMPLLLRSGDNNLKTVISKFLQSTYVSFIGVADPLDYHAYLKDDPALDSQFEKVYLNDASDDDTMAVLVEEYFQMELKSDVHITHKALKGILELSKRYVGSKGMPGKSVDVMRDAILTAKTAGSNAVRDEHIRSVVSLKAHMNVNTVTKDEKDKLMTLETELKKKVIGQEQGIKALVNALKRARLDLAGGKKPLGTFLFLGPTGVGKTETAKVLAQQYFGSVDSIIRLDMNEYGNENSVQNIIGTPDGQREGFLTKRVQDRPFSLILLDEIEKAHQQVLNLFLQVLDEGQLIDGQGVKTDFRNTIIIGTSNAGALFIRDFVQKHGAEQKEEFKKSLVESILQQKIFSPEFINRFDEVILYYPLTMESATKVAMLLINDVISDMQRKRGITIRMDAETLKAIAAKGYSVEFGAREMRRVVVESIETYLAEYMLNHEVKRGDEIVIQKDQLSLS